MCHVWDEDVAVPDPEAERFVRDLAERLVALPNHLREPLVMRLIEDLSYAEIAERLNLTNATARKRVQLAPERLRRAAD